MTAESHLDIRDLTMAYGETIIQENLTFSVRHGEIFVIMGGSGCGKSTLLRHLVGLMQPYRGQILIDGVNLWETSTAERNHVISRCGVLYQSGALWSSMTLAENIEVLLQEYTDLSIRQISTLSPTNSRWSDWPVSKIIIRLKSAVACRNAPDWPGPWLSIRRSCFSTSRLPDLIRSVPACWMI